MSLSAQYTDRFTRILQPLASSLQEQLQGCLGETPRVDRVQARAKSIDRFLAKAAKRDDEGKEKYTEPLHQIQDQVGARVIAFYLSDVEAIASVIERYYRPVETKDLVPESEWKFGYFGRHYVMLLPSDLVLPEWGRDAPQFFELQIKTLFQHAWSEANHDLGYKPGATPLPAGAERRLAFASAQAWGADQIFDELFRGPR